MRNLRPKSGPVSLAARLKSPAPEKASVTVEPLWTSRELGKYLGKSKNALSEFLNNTADFPAFKVGSEWRADGEAVRDWARRQRAQATMTPGTRESV